MSDESLCLKCGRCCRKKVMRKGKVVALKVSCPLLDTATNLCLAYEQRHKMKQHICGYPCGSVDAGIEARILPDDCPYAKDIKDYKCIVEVWE